MRKINLRNQKVGGSPAYRQKKVDISPVIYKLIRISSALLTGVFFIALEC